MKKIVIYDGGSFEITLREVMVGAIIVILMITMGFLSVKDYLHIWMN